MKKFLAELIGTFCLVFMGCGTAMLVGCSAASSGYLMTALAFGLSIVAMAYSIGNISGCHVNPAVSIAVWIRKGITSTELLMYIVAQIIGAYLGSLALMYLFMHAGVADMTGTYGANGLSGVSMNPAAGLLVECVLTFFFVLCILGVTSKKQAHGSFGGLIIGLTLTFVHIFGIGLTGTSVNPARSFGPAMANLLSGNSEPIRCLWVFIAGPIVGAVLAAVVYTFLESDTEKKKVEAAKEEIKESAEA